MLRQSLCLGKNVSSLPIIVGPASRRRKLLFSNRFFSIGSSIVLQVHHRRSPTTVTIAQILFNFGNQTFYSNNTVTTRSSSSPSSNNSSSKQHDPERSYERETTNAMEDIPKHRHPRSRPKSAAVLRKIAIKEEQKQRIRNYEQMYYGWKKKKERFNAKFPRPETTYRNIVNDQSTSYDYKKNFKPPNRVEGKPRKETAVEKLCRLRPYMDRPVPEDAVPAVAKDRIKLYIQNEFLKLYPDGARLRKLQREIAFRMDKSGTYLGDKTKLPLETILTILGEMEKEKLVHVRFGATGKIIVGLPMTATTSTTPPPTTTTTNKKKKKTKQKSPQPKRVAENKLLDKNDRSSITIAGNTETRVVEYKFLDKNDHGSTAMIAGSTDGIITTKSTTEMQLPPSS